MQTSSATSAAKPKPTPKPKHFITTSTRTIYLSNKELMLAVHESKQIERMTDTLAKMLQLLCFRYSKIAKFVGYPYNDDMQAYAMMMLVRTWASFNPEKSSNPFAFFTQCIHNSFVQYLNQEKRQRTIRDGMLVDQGMNPSFGYLENGTDHSVPGIEDEQDFDAALATAAYISRQIVGDVPIMRDDTGEEIIPTTTDE